MSAITLTDNMPSGSVCPFKPAAKKDFSSEEEISSGFFDDRLYEGMTGCPFKPAAKKNDDEISGGLYENEDEMYESMENLTTFLKYIAGKKYQEALDLSEKILKSDPDNLLIKDYIPILKDRILLDKEMKTWENDSIDSDDLDDLNDLKLDDDDDEDSSSSDDESLDANDDGNSSSSKEESEENSSVDESESDYDV